MRRTFSFLFNFFFFHPLWRCYVDCFFFSLNQQKRKYVISFHKGVNILYAYILSCVQEFDLIRLFCHFFLLLLICSFLSRIEVVRYVSTILLVHDRFFFSFEFNIFTLIWTNCSLELELIHDS